MNNGLVKIGKRLGLNFGHSRAPNDRASFAKRVLLFTSGKGGVGKSTVAVNVAVALAQRNLQVGILDADVYGPSMPRLLRVQDERAVWNDLDQMIPIENFGVKMMSVGLTTPEADTPLAWRSSVATSALIQLLEDVAWGELDILVIDMPPGTGDVQLTMAQELRIAGAIVVTTPQVVATDDVRRAIRMLLDIQVPIAGVVENMSYFVAPDNGMIHRPFGEGGGRLLARDYGVPFLGELPLSGSIRQSADDGHPIVATGTEAEKRLFREIAEKIIDPL